MNPRIAVIVPFFNAVDTLPQLVGALKAQTSPDFLAFFVDDGSTDGGRAYMDGVSREDWRFKVLAGAHAGPGPARNIGLDEAEKSGVEYVTFVDADDLPLPTMLAEAKEALESSGADIAHYQWSSTVGGTPHKDSTKGTPSIYVWNKLYRRSAIGDIRFIAAKFAEDLAFFLETESRKPRRVAIDRPLYVHFTRPGSLWESRSPEDVATSMRKVIAHLDPVMRASDPMLRRRWGGFYLVKLLKTWKKCLRKVLREKREDSVNEYIGFVAKVRFPCLCALRFRLAHKVFELRIKAKRSLRSLAEKQEVRHVLGNYERVKRRIAAYPASHKVRVLFHVTDVSKWKCQTVYEAMVRSGRFEPFVLVDLTSKEMALPLGERQAIINERAGYFGSRGYKIEVGYDLSAEIAAPVERFSPDVFFYQQPWGFVRDRAPQSVSRIAVCVYVPYYVVSPGDIRIDCTLPFQRMMYAYITTNDDFSRLYERVCGSMPRACRFVGLGNPIMDLYGNASSRECRDLVIYAPHWTFNHPNHNTVLKIGTFSEYGKLMLEYAKRHPEVKWVFKPHPCLRASLISSGAMSEEEVSAYYGEWERIGISCYDADYPELFNRARAMITDCGSFIAEFAATGSPLIHLVSGTNTLSPPLPFRDLWLALYQVRCVDELFDAIKAVLEDKKDDLRVKRIDLINRLGLSRRDVGEKIANYLERDLLAGDYGKVHGGGNPAAHRTGDHAAGSAGWHGRRFMEASIGADGW